METLFDLFNAVYPMSDGLQDYISKNLKRRELKRKELLLKKDQVNTIGSFLNTGLLHCYYLKKNGEKITSWFLQEKSLAISVGSFFSQEPSYECIEALKPCELYYLTHKELNFAYNTFLEFNFIHRVLIQKYYVQKEKHAYHLQMDVTAKDRFDWFQKTFPDLLTRVPMKHIATFLGVKQETLSRIGKQKY